MRSPRRSLRSVHGLSGSGLSFAVACPAALLLLTVLRPTPADLIDPAGSPPPTSDWASVERWVGQVTVERREFDQMGMPGGVSHTERRGTARISTGLTTTQRDPYSSIGYWEGEGNAQGTVFERTETTYQVPPSGDHPGSEFTFIREREGSGSAPGTLTLLVDPGEAVYRVGLGAGSIVASSSEWVEIPPEDEDNLRELCSSPMATFFGMFCSVLDDLEPDPVESTVSLPGAVANDIPLPSSGLALTGSADLSGGLTISWSLAPDDCASIDEVTLDVGDPVPGTEMIFDDSTLEPSNLSRTGLALVQPPEEYGAVEWDIPEIEGSRLVLDPEDARAPLLRFRYEGMPEDNNEFGDREVTVRFLPARPCVDAGDPTEIEVRFLFHRTHEGNPAGDVPNWLYYWSQTRAGHGLTLGGNLFYDRVCQLGERGADEFDPTLGYYLGWGDPTFAESVYVCEGAHGPAWNPVIRRSTAGIDTFGSVIAHELEHRDQFRRWWADFYEEWWGTEEFETRKRERDRDGDGIPDAYERALGLDPGRRDTHNLKMSDLEYLALRAEGRWVPGSADAEDWASPGRQSRR